MKSICYNCGCDSANTMEHVIARCFIPEPRPDNLITVPACQNCNQGIAQDEEYVRDRLSLVVAGADFDVPSTCDVALRSLRRKNASGKKAALFKEIVLLPQAFLTKDGPSDMAVLMQKPRVDRVIQKMIKGFFFFHFGKPLGSVMVEAEILSSINPKGDRSRIMRLLEGLYRSPTWAQNFGVDTHVICGLAAEDERAGLWSFKLLGQHILFALVAPPRYFEDHKLLDDTDIDRES